MKVMNSTFAAVAMGLLTTLCPSQHILAHETSETNTETSFINDSQFYYRQAKLGLYNLFTLETLVQKDSGSYIMMTPQGRIGSEVYCKDNELGFTPNPCDQTQAYYFMVRTKYEGGFIAFAVSGTGSNNLVAPGCPYPDIWSIDDYGVVFHVSDARAICQPEPQPTSSDSTTDTTTDTTTQP